MQMREFIPDGDTLDAFMQDPAAVKIIQGPIGSGKSLACAMCVYMKALEQARQKDGKRRARAHVFRETYAKLEETTVASWLDWFPEKEFGRFYWTKPFEHHMRIGDIELDVHFVALEDVRQIAFFKSLETTICWFNELQFTEKALFDEATTRVGRYPKVIDGGAIAPQVIADMNAPDEEHWVPIMRGDHPAPEWFTEEMRRAHVKPEGWNFYVQPPGLVERVGKGGEVLGYDINPNAENLKYLKRNDGVNYYVNAIKGKTKLWIDANVLNKVSPRKDGKPVLPDFRRELHVAKHTIEPAWGIPLTIGCDFARRPAAIIMQKIRGSWLVLDELIGRDMGADKFAPLLKSHLATRFPEWRYQIYGDPSGDFKGQNDDQTPFRIFRKHGLSVIEAPSILLTVRLQAAEAVLTRLTEGRAALQVSPNCKMLIAALDGGYRYRRLKTAGERYNEEPEKDHYSDPADAFMYALLGGGEGRMLLTGSSEPKKPANTKRPYNPLGGKTSRLRRW